MSDDQPSGIDATQPDQPDRLPTPSLSVLLDASSKETYYRLYEHSKAQLYTPALTALSHNLTTLLDSKLSPAQRGRCRVERGRIKDANRLLLKAQAPKYHDRIKCPADAFTVIRDIVGTRITCNTLSDVEQVVALIKAAATREEPSKPLIRTHDDWEDDYIRQPKESGYRAVNLLVGVPVARGDQFETVTCEVQVRTLLQHSWGELTHEDTYKPGVAVPPLVQVLSKRLATALAVLDEIAQDLRTELDKIEHQTSEAGASSGKAADGPNEASVTSGGPVSGDGDAEASARDASASSPNVERHAFTAAMLRSGFEAAFGSLPSLGNHALEVALERLQRHPVQTADQLEEILKHTNDDIRELERRFGVTLNDLGRISYALRLHFDFAQGVQKLSKFLEETASKRNDFLLSYPIGAEFLGTVIFSNPEYALVQLSDAHKGILRAAEIKADPRDYVEASEYVQQGDTLRVIITHTDIDRERITLTIDDRERRRLGLNVGG